MSDDLTSLFLALAIFSVGFISIGPNILAIIGTAMDRGRRDGMRLALGVGIGSSVWATSTVLGLTALVTAYAGALTILKWIGAAYLAWLAFKAFRSALTPDAALTPRSMRGGNLVLRGLTIQMTNPKAALQWIAIVGLGLGPDAPVWVGVTLIVVATTLSIVIHLAYAATFSTSPVIAFYRRTRRWIDGALGSFFAYAAYRLATYRE